MSGPGGLTAAARAALPFAREVIVFDERDRVVASTVEPALPAAELAEFRATLSRDRSEAIRRGVHVRGVRLEVMEHSPPLAYGRSLPPQPGSGLGWALCHVARPGRGGGGAWREVEGDAYALALFERPALSAEVVPALCVFAETHLKEAGDE